QQHRIGTRRAFVSEDLCYHRRGFGCIANRQPPVGDVRETSRLEIDEPIVAGRFHINAIEELRRNKVEISEAEIVLWIVTRISREQHKPRRVSPVVASEAEEVLYCLRRLVAEAELVIQIFDIDNHHRQSLTLPQGLERIQALLEFLG